MRFDIILAIIILIIHIICCVVLWLNIKAKILKVHIYMFFIALFLPFWGPLILLVLHFQIMIKQDDVLDFDVEKFKVESELYKSVTIDDSKVSQTTVAMEEALIINTSKIRRGLVMDVLNDNPKEYVEFLKKAGNNEDTEVVHYAVTAMVNISQENDAKLWEYEKNYQNNPNDLQNLTEYCSFLWSCLEQGLMQGQIEKMNRNLMNEIVEHKIKLYPEKIDYVRYIKNCLALKNYTLAKAIIDKAEKLYENDEEILIEKINYYAVFEKGGKIKEILESIDSEHIFLSAKAKEVIAFWEK